MAHLVAVLQSHATFALVVQDGRVVDAAPIARWAVGHPEAEVLAGYTKRGARLYVYPEETTEF